MAEIRESLKMTYNKIAAHFDATRKKTWGDVEEFIKEQPVNAVMLDLGAGTGRHALYAKKEGLKPVAGDFSLGQLRELRKKDKTIPLVVLDTLNLPFKSHSFDSVIYIAAIHHLESEDERIKSLKEAGRVLKRECLMLVSAWALEQARFKDVASDKGDVHYMWDGKYPRFYHLFRERELEVISKKAGFHVVSVWRVKDNIYVRLRRR
ncbi:MAG: class I SAM-dependent methyltransferase [Candidatus Omnitrophica bacterium]|nr:class I SAM-dependent methyltransferase [Candidatus Omnitrophota bacterium]